MFICSNCGHKIDDTKVRVPPFCPRCGSDTGEHPSPFEDDEPDSSSPLPPPPAMGSSLPPPPPSGRGQPSKTLFGMPGLSMESGTHFTLPRDDDEELAFPSDDDENRFGSDDESSLGDSGVTLRARDSGVAFPQDSGVAFPAPGDSGVSFPAGDSGVSFPRDDDDDLPFPSDDDEVPLTPAKPPAAKPPAAKPPAAKPPAAKPPAAKPPAAKPPAAKPPAAKPPVKPPPIGGKAAVKPPPIGKPSVTPPPVGGKAAVKPPPIGKPSVAPPPVPTKAAPPPLPSKPRPAPAPPPPSHEAFSSGVLSGESGVFGESGTFGDSGTFDKDDPFFTGKPDHVPELGSITAGDAGQFADESLAGISGIHGGDELELEVGESLELGEMAPPSDSQLAMQRGAVLRSDQLPPSGIAGLDMDTPSLALDDELPIRPTPAGDDGLDLPLMTEGTEALEFEFSGPPRERAVMDDGLQFGAPPKNISLAGDLDLPAPASGRGRSRDLDLPAPAGGISLGNDLDLPAPVADLDLPAPVGGIGLDNDLDLPASASGFDLPTPSGVDGLSLDDLPATALPGSLDDFPAPVDDFPAPQLSTDLDLLELDDLPTPGDDLPTPADILPTPADILPTPADILPTPADILPTPADILPTSAGADDESFDVDEMDEDDGAPDRRRFGLGQKPDEAKPGKGKPGKGKPGKTKPAKPAKDKSDKGKPGIGRILIYGGVGVVALGVLGFFAASEMGLLDSGPETDTQTTQGTPGDDDGTAPEPTELGERPEVILAKFDLDTPQAYVQAFEIAGEDPLAKAEAGLLLHLRYGPDPERLQIAGELLAPHQDAGEPYIARLIGLALLANGQLDPAAAKLTGDDARSLLYKSWVLLAQGKYDEARVAANAALEKRPGDRAAQLVVLRTRMAANPDDGLAAMRKAAEEQPDHLALQEALMQELADDGRLAEAAEVGRRLQPIAVSTVHKAELLRAQARIARAQGRTDVALRQLEQALATAPSLLDVRIDRIDLWLANQDLASVRSDVELLQQDQPTDPRVVKVAVRLAIETGDRNGDALTQLQALGEAGAADPEVYDLMGQVHALTMKVNEARAAWAEARKLDPDYTAATLAEVALLIKSDQAEAAVSFLEEQRKSLVEAGAGDRPEGRRALAVVERARASTLRALGQTEAALLAADDAIEADPSDNEARLLRAQLLAALGRRAAEEEALLELHERTGGFPGLTEPLGNVLLRQGKLDELEQLIGTSLDAPGASPEILLTGAALRLAQDKPDTAELLARKVLERDATSSRAHLLLGRALLARGDYVAALSEIEAAQTREGNPEVEVWLGQALEYNGRAPEARTHYNKALELDGNNLEAAALLGRLYAYDGAASKAIELIQPVIDKTDAYPYAYLALGLAHRDLGKRDLAVKDFKKARELDPTLFEAYYQEGRIHNDANKHSAAVAALQEGIDKAVANAQERDLIDTWRRLGESYYEIGRRADAKKALEEYLRLAPANAAGRREVERILGEL